MKTKFTSREIIEFYYFVTDEEDRGDVIYSDLLEEVYDSSHFPMWWKLDIHEENLYILFDEPLYFNSGETVRVGFQEYTIIKKKINLFDECIEYVLA